ncbi:hypothetical protein A8A54_18855 [Brucella pseudogrignonensis]|nr:hypothetical protein A8A54_18855 [Brucella pseudogrignonensis]
MARQAQRGDAARSETGDQFRVSSAKALRGRTKNSYTSLMRRYDFELTLFCLPDRDTPMQFDLRLLADEVRQSVWQEIPPRLQEVRELDVCAKADATVLSNARLIGR